jgi:hypothetical protein
MGRGSLVWTEADIPYFIAAQLRRTRSEGTGGKGIGHTITLPFRAHS